MSKENNNKKKRVSFHPDVIKQKDEIEHNDIDNALFETQKFSGDVLIEDFERHKKQTRKSLDPLKHIELLEEEEPVVKQQKYTVVKKDILNFKEKPKRNNHVDDFMYSHDIRFLDKIILMFNKNIYSDNKRELEKWKREWLKNSILPRTEHIQSLIKFMTDKMEKAQEKIEQKQKALNLDSLDVNTFKKFRNESRDKSKYEWYVYRKIQEMSFNKVLLEKEQNMEIEKAQKFKTLQKLENEIHQLQNQNDALEKEIEEHNTFIDNVNTPNTDDLEDLKYTLMEQSNRTETLKEDEESMKKKVFEMETEMRMTQSRIKTLKIDVDKLDWTIVGKSADENQLMQLQEENKVYEAIFKFKLCELSKDEQVKFALNNFEITCKLLPDTTVQEFKIKQEKAGFDTDEHILEKYFIDNMLNDLKKKNEGETIVSEDKNVKFIKNIINEEKKQKRLSISHQENILKEELLNTINFENTLDIFMKDTFKNEELCNETTKKCANFGEPKKLKQFVTKILLQYFTLVLLKKEIGQLKEFCKIDIFYVKQKIYLRFYLQTINKKFNAIDLCIDKDFYLVYEKKQVVDLNTDLCGLKEFVVNFVENK